MRYFANAMRDKDARRKIGFTALIIVICATLTSVPVFGIDSSYMSLLFGDFATLNFIDILSGGAMSSMTMASFGISSYITASIIIQLISIVFPQIDKVRSEGERGKTLIDRIEFVLAMVFTLISGTAMVAVYSRWGVLGTPTLLYGSIAVISWLAGSFLIIWLAKKIDNYGIGNGVSIILASNILSRIPSNVISFFTSSTTESKAMTVTYLAVLLAIFIAFYYIAVYLQKGHLDIPIFQSKKHNTGTSSNGRLQLNVSVASVLPVVYASALISFPAMIISIFSINTGSVAAEILACLTLSNWYLPEHWYYCFGLILYILLIIGFAYFSAEMSFNTDDIANNMRKNGDVIPGITPGANTSAYLTRRRNIVTVLNVIFLLVIVILPDFICGILNINSISYLGTSMIIAISVMFDVGYRIKCASLKRDKRYNLF